MPASRKTRQPQRLEDPAIVERYALVSGEIALFKLPADAADPAIGRARQSKCWWRIELILPHEQTGLVALDAREQFDRYTLLLINNTTRNAVAKRMMDMHSAICAAQRVSKQLCVPIRDAA